MRLIEAIGLIALASLIAFVGGCVKGQHEGETERMVLSAQVQNANSNVEACAVSLEALQQQAREDIARAEEYADAGKQALEDVVRENLAMADQLSEVERQEAQARLEPTCREQLEVELCPSVPLL